MLVAAEFSLGLLGAILARWLRIPLAEQLRFDGRAALMATAAVAPLAGWFAWASRSKWRPLARLRRQVQRIVAASLAGARHWELALAAAAAGVGEEVLFRGALQPLAAAWWGAPAALLAVSLLFGAAHAASRAYFVAATLMGAYLGWLALASGGLAVPILVHFLYDWYALEWFYRRATKN